jgi:TatA/E family protein of Tat protein translocase
VFALILDTLGSTELLFILVIALIFFGPRKLPQLAKSMGKGLAEFRKASDDFKRTWEREVALETTRAEDNSILEEQQPTYESAQSTAEGTQNSETPALETTTSEWAIPREDLVQAAAEPLPEAAAIPAEAVRAEPEPVTKQNWL